jgi:hypothetical protein
MLTASSWVNMLVGTAVLLHTVTCLLVWVSHCVPSVGPSKRLPVNLNSDDDGNLFKQKQHPFRPSQPPCGQPWVAEVMIAAIKKTCLVGEVGKPVRQAVVREPPGQGPRRGVELGHLRQGVGNAAACLQMPKGDCVLRASMCMVHCYMLGAM